MQNPMINKTEEMLYEMLDKLEKSFKADFLYINGPLTPDLVGLVRDSVEILRTSDSSLDIVIHIFRYMGYGYLSYSHNNIFAKCA